MVRYFIPESPFIFVPVSLLLCSCTASDRPVTDRDLVLSSTKHNPPLR